MFILYFIIAVLSTTIGAMTGMGGGVIIKPVLDVIGAYDAATVGVLSSVTVFAMAIISSINPILMRTSLKVVVFFPLAIGAAFGGILGQYLFDIIALGVENKDIVVIIQNAVLAFLILGVYWYIHHKSRIKPLHKHGAAPTFSLGIFLGIVSSFLGIGGGPMNVALIIYVFGCRIKTAVLCSIISILFSQSAKLISIFISTGFECYDLSVLPVMAIGAILGGFLGRKFGAKLSNKSVEKAFDLVQLIVLILCIVNIIRKII